MIQSIFARPVQLLMSRLGCGRQPCEQWAQCSHRLPPVGGASISVIVSRSRFGSCCSSTLAAKKVFRGYVLEAPGTGQSSPAAPETPSQHLSSPQRLMSPLILSEPSPSLMPEQRQPASLAVTCPPPACLPPGPRPSGQGQRAVRACPPAPALTIQQFFCHHCIGAPERPEAPPFPAYWAQMPGCPARPAGARARARDWIWRSQGRAAARMHGSSRIPGKRGGPACRRGAAALRLRRCRRARSGGTRRRRHVPDER